MSTTSPRIPGVTHWAAVAAVVIGLAACSGAGEPSATPDTTAPPSTTATTATTVVRPTATVDGAVHIAAGNMHLRCVGSGTTTVILIAGWGGDIGSWVTIEPALAEHARVCSYSRFGTGTSDAPSTTQTFRTQAADLHELLEAAGEPGPYVVVGHSFGGAESVEFASQYPDEVAGLMLVDASPTSWPAAVCAVPDDGTEIAASLQGLCAVMHDPAQDPERLDVFAAFDEVATIDSLGDLPMTVMTATHRSLAGLAADEVARLDGVWDDGVGRWASLSTASKVVPVEDTGHNIQFDQPALVVEELLQLLP